MIVYHTDYSTKNDNTTAWVKKVTSKKKVSHIKRVGPNGIINGSFLGEIMAVYFALVDAVHCGYSTVTIKNDNKVVVELINRKNRKTRKSEVKFVLFLIDDLRARIKNLSIEWVPREENREADSLTKCSEVINGSKSRRSIKRDRKKNKTKSRTGGMDSPDDVSDLYSSDDCYGG